MYLSWRYKYWEEKSWRKWRGMKIVETNYSYWQSFDWKLMALVEWNHKPSEAWSMWQDMLYIVKPNNKCDTNDWLYKLLDNRNLLRYKIYEYLWDRMPRGLRAMEPMAWMGQKIKIDYYFIS